MGLTYVVRIGHGYDCSEYIGPLEKEEAHTLYKELKYLSTADLGPDEYEYDCNNDPSLPEGFWLTPTDSFLGTFLHLNIKRYEIERHYGLSELPDADHKYNVCIERSLHNRETMRCVCAEFGESHKT